MTMALIKVCFVVGITLVTPLSPQQFSSTHTHLREGEKESDGLRDTAA